MTEPGRLSDLPTLADMAGQRRAPAKGGTPAPTARQGKAIRAQLFEDAGNVCVCCGFRRADSLHEVKPRSIGGVISLSNSVPLCGSGTTGCHGLCQRYEIKVSIQGEPGHEEHVFAPDSKAARAWLAPPAWWGW